MSAQVGGDDPDIGQKPFGQVGPAPAVAGHPVQGEYDRAGARAETVNVKWGHDDILTVDQFGRSTRRRGAAIGSVGLVCCNSPRGAIG